MKYLSSAFPRLALVLPALLLVSGCAGMSQGEQRMVSGAAIGAVVGGPVGGGIGALFGAGVGAGVGYAVDRSAQPAGFAADPTY